MKGFEARPIGYQQKRTTWRNPRAKEIFESRDLKEIMYAQLGFIAANEPNYVKRCKKMSECLRRWFGTKED